ncbi:SpoIIE family protein phosphatase [Methylomonas sp. SURF-1]|uniref:SpoIIE family protein phosphatase n=1 Tax=Methylomonas aurea TaxID=2952224 RepID=A0ABT1UJS0_9GAMM|nr:SpoIIE family protein phosphatase [Methylomonas sp. SURF-1]MCQ8182458.1 SpoIIE family protein phosphatase [Methylomonas sp. SURF-1]
MVEILQNKILCVDDEPNVLDTFKRTLGRQFALFTASSAADALRILEQERDIAVIVSDYSMPGTDGLAFLKRAGEISPDSVQIVLTGNIELDIAIRAINEAHIFRYLPKPCPLEVTKKIIADALAQYRLVVAKRLLSEQLEQKNLELLQRNAELAEKQALLEHELETAKIVCSKFGKNGYQVPDGLDFFISAKDAVGGDFILNAVSRDGQAFYLMMGDLTGHGLQSALGGLLVTEIFDEQCLDHPPLEQLVNTINRKMCRKLPTGLFCAASLIALDLADGRLQAWNGGMPDIYFLDQQGQIADKLHSANLPLGIAADPGLIGNIAEYDVGGIESVFLYSDGVTDQIGADLNLFGVNGLQRALEADLARERRIDRIEAQLRAHQQQQPQSDDISMAEINLPRICRALAIR